MGRTMAGMLSLALLLAACSAGTQPAESGPTAPSRRVAPTRASATLLPAAATPTSRPAAPTASPASSGGGHGHVVDELGGPVAVSFPAYESLTDWARQHRAGIAIVEIVDVSEPRWSTPTGERPPEDLLHDPPAAGHGDISWYGIGRLVTVRLVRILRGEWPAPTAESGYWLVGGTVGQDREDSLVFLQPPVTPAMDGRLGLAFLAPSGLIGTPPTIPSSVAELFPADEQGRISTPLGVEEGVTLENVESFLP